jgi:hypothetical protein
MNRDRMRTLAKHLKNNDPPPGMDGFDYGLYVERTDCGTVGCIAGWAVYLFSDERALVTLASDEIFIEAARLLELSPRQADLLFANEDVCGHVGLSKAVTAKDAARAIESMMNGNPEPWADFLEAQREDA